MRARQEGRWVYYSVNRRQVNLLEQYLSEYSRRAAGLLSGRYSSCQ
ncbi:hypothetical protein L8106_19381 [Lyngbya sp. PCC 8106]|nr:hypothetical protein L8106_19381 [Lyngbya sp. PCC 8106]